MKLKILAALLASTLIPVLAQAQIGDITNPLNGRITVVDAGTCSTANSFVTQQLPQNASTTTVNLSGTFTATLTARVSNNGGATWTTAGAVAAGTSSFSTNGFTHICVDATAFTSGTVLVSISTGLLQVQSVVSGGSSSSTSNPAQAIIASPLCAAGSTICNFVNADAHFSSTATTTNGSGIVTLPNADFNFNGTDANGKPIAKVGELCWVTSNGGAFLNQMGTLVVGQGTISSINSNTSITCSNNANANLTGTAWLFWGDDDSANLAAFWTNVGCLQGILPQGYMLVQQAEFTTAPTANCSTLSNSVYQSPTLRGQGITATWIIPTPNFNAATCSISPWFQCFGNQSTTVWRDFSIWGGGHQRTASATTHTVFLLGSATRAYDVDVEYWATLENLWTCVVMNGNQDLFQLGGGFGCGGKAAVFVPSSLTAPAESIGNFWSSVVSVSGTAAVDIAGPMYELDDFVAASGTLGSSHLVESTGNSALYSSTILSQTNVSAMRVDGVENIHDSWVGVGFGGGAAPASTFALFTQNANAIVRSENTVFTGGAGGGSLNFITAGAKFYDECGNTFSGGTAVTNPANGNIIGSCSASTTVLTTAKLVLSANWGTSAAVSVPVGFNAPITFTITNGSAATGAAPTITYTFPNPYLQAPLWCTATQSGGTNAVGTFAVSGLSTTGVTFTFSLTPTASSTETVQVQCPTQ